MQHSESSVYRFPSLTAVVIVVISLILIVLGFVFAADRFFASYLVAFLYWTEIALGCLGLLLVTSIIHSRWGIAIQRPASAGALTLLLMLVFFVPLFLGLDQLYPWMASDYPEKAHLPDGLQYLSPTFFILRSLVSFVIWVGIAFLLEGALSQYDESGKEELLHRARFLGALGAVLFVITASFVAIDWSMSLDPYWFSSIYGWLAIARQGMVAFAFIVLILAFFAKRKAVSELLNQRTINDLGTIQLGTIMLWAYMHFFQYLIMWSGNLPKEARWFVPRTTGGWDTVALILVVFHLAIPLIMLILPEPKRTMGWLSIVSILLLVSHLGELFWLVLPNFLSTPTFHWLDIVLPVAVGGIWVSAFLWLLAQNGLVVQRHPVLDEAGIQHRSEVNRPGIASG